MECPPEVSFPELLKSAIVHEETDQQQDDPGVLADARGADKLATDSGVLAISMPQDCGAAFEAAGNACSTGGASPNAATSQPNRPGSLAVDTPPTILEQESHRQSRSNHQRKRKRETRIVEEGYAPMSYAIGRHIKPAVAVKTDLKVTDLPATSCGYVALSGKLPETRTVLPAMAEELVRQGYELIPNDGV